MIDTYVGFVYKYNIIKKNRFLSIINKLDELRKLIYGWSVSEKATKV
ncbi:MAG: hypothetical protein PHX04_04265 [Bacilli bacterium]|nr:hypothetical protein [Bacilli bacterium]